MPAMRSLLLRYAPLFYRNRQHLITAEYNTLAVTRHLNEFAGRQTVDGTSSGTRRLSSSASATRASGDNEYDYVVVGAGSAGCTIANRLVLSDDKTLRVLITEAGMESDQSLMVRVPAAMTLCLRNKQFDWMYETSPQKHVNGRRMFWPRGKGLGGSSCINAMVYIRGHAADYDRWAFKEGATGWSYAENLPYFIRSQKHELGANEFRGGAGDLSVVRARSENPLFNALVEAGRQAGYPVTDDFNGVQQEGFGRYDSTISDGQRASVAAMYLRPAMKEAGDRLTVSIDTHVHRVIFNGRRAVGIEYQTGGKGSPIKRAYATREVILCGGAVNSPQLLMLSGIGPADELRRHNIQLLHHSPGVGTNLNDHLRLDVQYRCKKPVSINLDQLPHRAVPAGIQWLWKKTGPLSMSVVEGGGFVRSRPDVSHPDIQFLFAPGVISDHTRIPLHHGFEVCAVPLRPTSRGTITLKSADPYDHVAIDPNYLATKKDIEDTRASVRIAREVINQRAFDEYRGEELVPGIACQSDKEIDACVREKSETLYHPTSTCRMGSPEKDDMVVVDTMCRVVGVEGLRVVDASIMPSLVSGNTNAPTIMIAEKASDMILGKPLLPKTSLKTGAASGVAGN